MLPGAWAHAGSGSAPLRQRPWRAARASTALVLAANRVCRACAFVAHQRRCRGATCATNSFSTAPRSSSTLAAAWQYSGCASHSHKRPQAIFALLQRLCCVTTTLVAALSRASPCRLHRSFCFCDRTAYTRRHGCAGAAHPVIPHRVLACALSRRTASSLHVQSKPRVRLQPTPPQRPQAPPRALRARARHARRGVRRRREARHL